LTAACSLLEQPGLPKAPINSCPKAAPALGLRLEAFGSDKPWGRSVQLAVEMETASRMKSFNTLIEGFRFIRAILNYRIFFFF